MKKLKSLLFALMLIPALAFTEGSSTTSVININTADQATLTQLKQIGESKAAAIVADRKSRGDFATVNDLTRVKGIGPAILKANKGMITVGNTSPE